MYSTIVPPHYLPPGLPIYTLRVKNTNFSYNLNHITYTQTYKLIRMLKKFDKINSNFCGTNFCV